MKKIFFLLVTLFCVLVSSVCFAGTSASGIIGYTSDSVGSLNLTVDLSGPQRKMPVLAFTVNNLSGSGPKPSYYISIFGSNNPNQLGLRERIDNPAPQYCGVLPGRYQYYVILFERHPGENRPLTWSVENDDLRNERHSYNITKFK